MDISKYATPKFDSMQMFEIRVGLVRGVDVSEYANPQFDWEQMCKVRERLEAERN